MNSYELEIFDHLEGFEVENVRIDRNAVAHGEPAMQVSISRKGYEPDVFWFRKDSKMKADQMGTIIRSTLRKELEQ